LIWKTGLIRPRTSDGNFIPDFAPGALMFHAVPLGEADQLGFQEGTTWQYTWMVPHNYAGLFRMMGGSQNVLAKLDKFFQKLVGWGVPNFTVSNEPDFCAPYAYVWTGNARKTQEVVDRIRRETFTAKPDGIPGNDDLGATSGVYVWNALGMYSVIPGVGEFVLGTPMFPRVIMQLGDGRSIEIVSHGTGIYVHAVSLNRAPHTSSWLPLDKLSAGHNRLELLRR
jgi:putative alpha-1,2-mannosidase